LGGRRGAPVAGLQHTIRIEVRLDDPCEISLRHEGLLRRILTTVAGVTCDSPRVDDVEDRYASTVATLRAAGCVYAEDEASLILGEPGDPTERIARRVAGEPLEWVLGWAEFADLRITVRPGVFVPRRRTELLAAEAIARLRPAAVAVELCCGAGAVAATILEEVPFVEVHAADVDPVAVACARDNLPNGNVHQGDLFAALPADLRGRIDVLAANTPYVPSAEVALMPPEARDHEPRATLDGGPDGLVLLRRISVDAKNWLAPGGHVLIELSERQLPVALGIFQADGLVASSAHDPELGATVVIGLASAT
jgi:release factor glutamine methyltransferase